MTASTHMPQPHAAHAAHRAHAAWAAGRALPCAPCALVPCEDLRGYDLRSRLICNAQTCLFNHQVRPPSPKQLQALEVALDLIPGVDLEVRGVPDCLQ